MTITHSAGILDLPVLYRFENHAGFDGVMFGLPGGQYHLEFTRSRAGSPCPAPSNENLLVLYFESDAAMYDVVERLAEHGCEPVPAGEPVLDRPRRAPGSALQERQSLVSVVEGEGVRRGGREGRTLWKLAGAGSPYTDAPLNAMRCAGRSPTSSRRRAGC